MQLDDGKYCCPVCDKMFGTSSAIVRHYRTHTGKCVFYLSDGCGISCKEFFHAVVYTLSPPFWSWCYLIITSPLLSCWTNCKVLAMQQTVGHQKFLFQSSMFQCQNCFLKLLMLWRQALGPKMYWADKVVLLTYTSSVQ